MAGSEVEVPTNKQRSHVARSESTPEDERHVAGGSDRDAQGKFGTRTVEVGVWRSANSVRPEALFLMSFCEQYRTSMLWKMYGEQNREQCYAHKAWTESIWLLREARATRLTNRRGSPLQCCRVVKELMGTTSWGTVSAGCGARVALSDAELDNDKLLRPFWLKPFPARTCTVLFPFRSVSGFVLSKCLQPSFAVHQLFSWHV